MSYGDFRRRDVPPIAEREWCIGRTIQSTAVTSCIILVAPAGSRLFGIHLSLVGEGDSVFGQQDAESVVQIMRSNGVDTTNVHAFGEVDFWGPGIEGYQYLQQQFSIREHQRNGSVTVRPEDVGSSAGTSCGCCVIM